MTDTTGFRVWLGSHSQAVDTNDPVVEELRAMSRLAGGWSYGQGRPIATAVLQKAERFLELGFQLHLQREVFPGRNGEVAVVFHQGDLSVQVTVNAELSLGLRVERGHGSNYEDVVDPVDRGASNAQVLRHIVSLVNDDTWKSHASSTSSTLVEYTDGSSTSRLRTQIQ